MMRFFYVRIRTACSEHVNSLSTPVLSNASLENSLHTMRPTGKLLVQAEFELAPSGYRSDALPIELLSPTENDIPLASQYRFIMFTCCPEDDSN